MIIDDPDPVMEPVPEAVVEEADPEAAAVAEKYVSKGLSSLEHSYTYER